MEDGKQELGELQGTKIFTWELLVNYFYNILEFINYLKQIIL